MTLQTLDLTKQAGGSYSTPNPLALQRTNAQWSPNLKSAPAPERGQRYASGEDSELDVDRHTPSERNAPLIDAPPIADPTLVQPSNRRTSAGWDSKQSIRDPRDSADAADADIASPTRPLDLVDPTLVQDDPDDDDAGDTDSDTTKARHPLTGRFVEQPASGNGAPEAVRDAAPAANALEVQYPSQALGTTPHDTLSDIESSIDRVVGRAHRVGTTSEQRANKPAIPLITPRG